MTRYAHRVMYGTATQRRGVNPDTVELVAYRPDAHRFEFVNYYTTERGYRQHVTKLVNDMQRDGDRIIVNAALRNGGRFIVYMPHWARGPHAQPYFALIPPIWHEREV